MGGPLPGRGAGRGVGERVPSRQRTPQCRIDVLAETVHNIEHRREQDTNVIDVHDVTQLAANADVGYHAWQCPKPLKSRDVVTLRCWHIEDGHRTVTNFSIKLRMVKKPHKACVKYPAQKQQHEANMNPWPDPEQNALPPSPPSEVKAERGEHGGSEKGCR
nr:PREDICTED: PCTP-like protein [Pelecanus crispus]